MSAFIVNLMKSLREMTQLPDTCDDLTWKFLKLLSSGYNRVDIVTDYYQEVSLKSAKRKEHGI